MASFSNTATLDQPGIARGRDGNLPPSRNGGGGGDDARSGSAPDFATRLRRARLGLFVALTPILMLFVSFTSAYVVRQGLPTLDPRTNLLVRDWVPVKLPALLFVNTFVLLLSTVVMELARRQSHAETQLALAAPGQAAAGAHDEGKMPWLAMTLVLGLLFLFGQWAAWRQLGEHGFYLSTTPSSSFVYLLTGTHAVHLMGGVLALIVASIASLFRHVVARRSIVLDVTAWYWHFMALLWVYIFCLLEFAK